MNLTTRRARFAFLGLLVVMSLVGTACSSSDGDSAADDDLSAVVDTTSAAEASGSDGDDAGETPAGDFDCDLLGEHAAIIRGANGWVPQVDDAASFELIGGDLDVVDAAIEGLRPIQDIDGVFGPVREGLDNLSADIQAIRDGRYDEKVGVYMVAGINAVLGEEVCS